MKRELRLSEEKARRLEGMYAKLESSQKTLFDKVTQERTKLNQMTSERVADESAYSIQVAVVESLWAKWRESRTVTIYRMFLELQPEQHRKLQEIFARRTPAADGRGRGPGPGSGR